MRENDIECGTFTVISIDSLLVHENKYYPQVYLGNCVYKIIDKWMMIILMEILLKLMKISLWGIDLTNAVLR